MPKTLTMNIKKIIENWGRSIVHEIRKRTPIAGKGIKIDQKKDGVIVSTTANSGTSSEDFIYNGPFTVEIDSEDNSKLKIWWKIGADVSGFLSFSQYGVSVPYEYIDIPDISSIPEDDCLYLYIHTEYIKSEYLIKKPIFEIRNENPIEMFDFFKGYILIARLKKEDEELKIIQESYGHIHSYIYAYCEEE